MRNRFSSAKGRFIPKNPQKYVGNPNNIMFRSSWEFRFFVWLDQNPAVLRWGSEELAIPYVSPLDMRVHRYFPDIIILYKHQDGSIRKEIVEIKPYSQTVAGPRMSDWDKQTLLVNRAKWEAAARYAEMMGSRFRIVTEKSMFAGIRKTQAPEVGKAV